VKFGEGYAIVNVADRWSRFLTPQVILGGAILSVIVSVLTVNFFGRYLSGLNRSPHAEQALGHFAAFGFLLLTGVVVGGAVLTAFRRGDTKGLLITVFVSYFSLMLLFASVYYEAAFFGDFQDAVFKYDSYRYDAVHNIAGPRYLSRRAFFGIEPRFWSGVDWPVHTGRFPNGLPPGAYRIGVAEMRQIAASRSEQDVVQFVPEARLEIFADCLHLSVITMTTVGYGDITPRSLPARLGTDIEAISNTLLLIFGVGIILGSRRQLAPATQGTGGPAGTPAGGPGFSG